MVAKVECKFCNSNPGKIILKGDLGFAAWDSFPVNQGHVLVIPYRHVSEYFDATDSEKQELWSLVDKAKAIIDEKYAPDGYNVGINIGHSI